MNVIGQREPQPNITPKFFKRLESQRIRGAISCLSSYRPQHFPQVSSKKVSASCLYRSLFNSRFSKHLVQMVEPLVDEAITTWKCAFELFFALEPLRQFITEFTGGPMVQQTCTLFKEKLYLRGFTTAPLPSKCVIGEIDLTTYETSCMMLNDIYVTKMSVDKQHLIIYDSISKNISYFDRQTFTPLLEFPHHGQILGMKAQKGKLYILYSEGNRYAIQAFVFENKYVVNFELSLPLTDCYELWRSTEYPFDIPEGENGYELQHYYFAEGFVFLFFASTVEGVSSYINIIELPTFNDKPALDYTARERIFNKMTKASLLQLRIPFTTHPDTIDCTYSNGLLYVAFQGGDVTSGNSFCVFVYENETRLQTYKFISAPPLGCFLCRGQFYGLFEVSKCRGIKNLFL